MSMKFHDFPQGSDAWHQHRATHFNASDAPAMMGCSPYMTRTELMARMKTGISADVDASTQRRFDDGHRFEALARPLAEEIIGDDLYPVTGSRGKLSASFDGLTLDNSTAFEHKTLGEALRYTPWDEGNGEHLPLHYRVQMEQQMLVSGAERVLFMASKWAGDNVELIEERHCWYVSDPDLRAKIVAGWQQFEKDLAEFVPTAAEAPKPTGKAPESLPALHIVIQGGVQASNLAEFKATALSAIRSVNRELTTDAHFADAEKAVKWCEDVESRIKAAKDHALSQTASIDELFRTMDEISAEARDVRLELTKLVKARKDAIKADIVADGIAALAKHIRELNAAMPANYMPQVPADFGGAIKGLRTLDSIRNAVNTELANAKIRASEIANRIHANVKAMQDSGLVFHDDAALVLKAPDDLAAVIAQRKAAEQARIDAERERIRKEETDRAEREAAARAAAEKAEAERLERERIEAQAKADVAKITEAQTPQQVLKAEALAPDATARGVSVTASPSVGSMGAGQAADAAPVGGTPEDNGTRLTLGQINERLSPVSITVSGLSELGFEPVQQIKASRLYRECDFPVICRAIAQHVIAAAQTETA